MTPVATVVVLLYWTRRTRFNCPHPSVNPGAHDPVAGSPVVVPFCNCSYYSKTKTIPVQHYISAYFLTEQYRSTEHSANLNSDSQACLVYSKTLLRLVVFMACCEKYWVEHGQRGHKRTSLWLGVYCFVCLQCHRLCSSL